MLVVILLISFFLLLVIGVPISFSLSISSFLAVGLTGGQLLSLVQKTFRAIDSFTLLAIPFFVFAGNVMARGGVSKRLTDMASTMVGRLPGGLAHVATVSSMFFGAISGSAPATTSAIGAVMVPGMEQHKYDKAFTAAVVASSGTIGLIIPPSVTMVMYGTLANASVGKMFIGGVGPGILMTIVICLINFFISKKRGYGGADKPNAKAILNAFKNGIWALLMPVIILGGIYSLTGLCTGPVGEFMVSAAATKMGLGPAALFARGILCNFLVCLAVWCAGRASSDAGKLIMVFWCLFAFITTGFEHSIANMTLFTVALLQPVHEAVTIGGSFYNLIIVTLGNIVGGAVFVAVPYYTAGSRDK